MWGHTAEAGAEAGTQQARREHAGRQSRDTEEAGRPHYSSLESGEVSECLIHSSLGELKSR